MSEVSCLKHKNGGNDTEKVKKYQTIPGHFGLLTTWEIFDIYGPIF